MAIISCPKCHSTTIKKHGHIHSGKQNYRCNGCGRQFVLNPENKQISNNTKNLIRRLLLERVSLRGICRVVKVSLTWLLDFIVKVYGQLPGHLYAQAQVAEREGDVILCLLDAQADELWSFVGNKEN